MEETRATTCTPLQNHNEFVSPVVGEAVRAHLKRQLWDTKL